jgi:hypothetical protein
LHSKTELAMMEFALLPRQSGIEISVRRLIGDRTEFSAGDGGAGSETDRLVRREAGAGRGGEAGWRS